MSELVILRAEAYSSMLSAGREKTVSATERVKLIRNIMLARATLSLLFSQLKPFLDFCPLVASHGWYRGCHHL